VRRRHSVPERVYTLDDMPEHLRRFDPLEWGCTTVYQNDPEWIVAFDAFRREVRKWTVDHDVNVLEELRAKVRARRLTWKNARGDMPFTGGCRGR
jgi:hypothetical protein